MAFNDIEHKRIEKTLQAFIDDIRPAAHIRAQLDFGFDIVGQSVELVEIRPDWQNPAVIHRRAYAKATFVRTQNIWKVYWMRASGKWDAYEPHGLVRTVGEFLTVVKADPYGCFFG